MAMITNSEHGEDILIHRLLLWARDGLYLDVGAYNSEKMSITKRLRKFGWSGVNVDIDEAVIGRLKVDIPSDINICSAIGIEGKEYTFHQYEDAVINTISENQYEHLKRIEENGELFTRPSSVCKVIATSLSRILRENSIPDLGIGYMNIDIEGMELEALEGFPWDTQSPRVISVEIHKLNLHRCEDNDCVKFLKNQGYRLQSYVFHTAIFCETSFDEELCHRHQFPSQ